MCRWKANRTNRIISRKQTEICCTPDLESAEADEHDVPHSDAHLPPHFATDVAHALHAVEAVSLEPGPTVHLEHLRILLALVDILEVQLTLTITIALGT